MISIFVCRKLNFCSPKLKANVWRFWEIWVTHRSPFFLAIGKGRRRGKGGKDCRVVIIKKRRGVMAREKVFLSWFIRVFGLPKLAQQGKPSKRERNKERYASISFIVFPQDTGNSNLEILHVVCFVKCSLEITNFDFFSYGVLKTDDPSTIFHHWWSQMMSLGPNDNHRKLHFLLNHKQVRWTPIRTNKNPTCEFWF